MNHSTVLEEVVVVIFMILLIQILLTKHLLQLKRLHQNQEIQVEFIALILEIAKQQILFI